MNHPPPVPAGAHRTDWLHDARWGLCVHFLAGDAGQRSEAETSPEAWNRQVDAFDVDRFIGRVASLGAGYVLFTVGQNSGYYCSPNTEYERRIGRPAAESRLSRRDLIADLGDAAERAGVRLCVYVPSHAPANDRLAVERLACTPRWDASAWGLPASAYTVADGVDEALTEFQASWEAILREWSVRWGERAHAWWIDGCYFADRMYRGPAAPNFASFASALRAGNTEALVGFASGTRVPIRSLTEAEDYTAGEANHLIVAEHGWKPDRWVDGKQLHVLTYLSEAWGRGRPRFTPELARAWMRHFNALGGAVTWDVPIEADGSIPDPFLDIVSRFND